MRSGQFEQFIEERVTILTDSERVEGLLYYAGGTRLSDYLNSSVQQETKFLKVKDPTVYCRRSGDELIKVPFLMVSRDRIVMLMTYSSTALDDRDQTGLFGSPPTREPSTRIRG